MSGKQIRALTIKVNPSSQPAGVEYQWDKLPQPEVFIKNIEIPELNADDSSTKVNLGAIVSGVPSVFARASLFKNALDNITDNTIQAKGMLSFYKQLISEWRGFISCIALNYSDLTIKRIWLKYSDGSSVYDTANIYEPTGAFGNMLFDRRPLWIDQNKPVHDTDNHPFIDVISYKGIVVGGTTPDSFVFTSSSYSVDERKPYLRNGKFVDPLESDLDSTQLNVLFGYCSHILRNHGKFLKQFDKVPENIRPNFSNIIRNLEEWIESMQNYAKSKGWQTVSEQVPEIPLFQSPFNVLFNHSTELYGLNGIITTDSDAQPGSIQFDPKNLLLPPSTELFQIRFDFESEKDPQYLFDKPLLLLKAEVKNQPNRFAYFTLPLTPLALNVFGENLADLVGIENRTVIRSRLNALYDQSGSLYVTLRLETQSGEIKSFEVKYPVEKEVKGLDMLLWPNFISKQWNRYFFYNEMPHNNTDFQVHPFIGHVDDEHFRILFGDDGEPILLAHQGQINNLPSGVKAQLHIASTNAVAGNRYKYEIYECNQPFKGVKFSFANKSCGYALIRYDELGNKQTLPQNKLREPNLTLKEAHLGIDFGSTNSSVAYYSKDDGEMVDEMFIKNRRISLLSRDHAKMVNGVAVENDVFFFSGQELRSNSLKSLITIHDSKRVIIDVTQQSTAFGMPVKGGFPNFEKNLPVESSENSRYKLNFPRAGIAEVIYDMKWKDGSSSQEEQHNKQAYLGTLLLQIYAELFERKHQPVVLKWSYPSSMSQTLLGEYDKIWRSLTLINPLIGGRELEIANSPVKIDEMNTNSFGNPNANGSSWGSQSQSMGGTQPTWGSQSYSQVGSSNQWGNSSADSQSTANSNWNPIGSSGPTSNNLREIDIDEGPINFNLTLLDSKKALSEACAVANYIVNSNKVSQDANNLTLCFDIGGSTTDISALCPMQYNGGTEVAMVKQNSIRFAAQRITSATEFSPNLKSVLLEICDAKKLIIQGLNIPPDKFSSKLAPYYFEQIIDRLSEEDFPAFYKLIRSKCPEMFSINLYVTGLIMYYAGQLAYKLRKDISNSKEGSYLNSINGDMGGTYRPIINIVFAGKGARIFDWFKAIDDVAATRYYTNLFILGFGGMQKAVDLLFPGGVNGGPPIIINPTNQMNSRNLKYEVSKGLAHITNRLLVPEKDGAREILGEENFVIVKNGKMTPLPFDASITPEMMENLGSLFMSSPPPGKPACPKFMEFASVFFQVAKGVFGLKMDESDFMTGFQKMNINSYIKTRPDYNIAKQNPKSAQSPFGFVAPIIILEGMQFMEETLLNCIKRS